MQYDAWIDMFKVLDEVAKERESQIEKGWTPEHDDTHSTGDMLNIAADWLEREDKPLRERLIQSIAIQVAAVESMDRQAKAGDL